MKTIKKSIEINAPKEEVWSVLTEDKSTRVWYSAFSEGSHADTNWEVGSNVTYKDNSGCGMIARVITNKVNEELGVEYIGELMPDGSEDYDSENAKKMQGGKEIYRISESKGVTQLDVSADMSDEYFVMMSNAWDKALLKLKELAEGK